MTEQFTPANASGISLCYETYGSASDPCVLLIMGLGTQMLGWDARFCSLLADRGFFVVRFDNRDIGRSTRLAGMPPTLVQMVRRDKRAAHYTLSDMAADAVGLLDVLGVGAAHIVGASMGGMIAQTVAFEHPTRTLTLTSIMSNAGTRFRGQPKWSVLPVFLKRAPADREGYAQHIADLYDLIGSPGFKRSREETLERARTAFDRGVDPASTGRQLGAILADGDRTARLRTITAPTLVIHGRADRLVQASGGREVAKAIPGAQLELIDGMGHDLPPGLWPILADLLEGHAARARTAARPAAV